MRWLGPRLVLLLSGCGRIAFSPVDPGTDARPSIVTTHRLALGYDFTCLLRDDGSVQCWGNGVRGRLGNASTATIGDDEPIRGVQVGLGEAATQIAAGADHACARLATGGARCWGVSDSWQLGYPGVGDVGDDELPAAIGDVQIGTPVDEIVAAGQHSCARTGGEVRCWGLGAGGRLGTGSTTNIGDDETPAAGTNAALGGQVVQLDARGSHSCALLVGGLVRCWGGNLIGQLGYGNTSNIGDDERPESVGPVDVGGTVVQIATGAASTCARLAGGAVRCWGENVDGRLGYGHTSDIGDDELPSSAGDVPLGGVALAVSIGAEQTCALLDSGAVRCWGGNTYGQLGYGNTNAIGDDETPASAGDVPLGGRAVEVVAGGTHTCAVMEETGAVRCWGDNSKGQLGYGNTIAIGDDETPASAGDVPID